MHTRLCGKSCFSHTSAFNLWRPFRFPNFNMFFSACVNKIFQKWTVFVFSEIWSRDHCHANGVLSMLEEQSTYPGQLSARATTRASPSLKGSSAKKRAARLGVSPSTVCLERWRFSAHVCRRCDIGRSSLFSWDQEDNWVHIRRNLTPCSRTHFPTLEVFLASCTRYCCLALPVYKQANLSFVIVVFIWWENSRCVSSKAVLSGLFEASWIKLCPSLCSPREYIIST